MITIQDLELLASLVQRAGVNQIEALWANSVFVQLRDMIETAAQQAQPPDCPDEG